MTEKSKHRLACIKSRIPVRKLTYMRINETRTYVQESLLAEGMMLTIHSHFILNYTQVNHYLLNIYTYVLRSTQNTTLTSPEILY